MLGNRSGGGPPTGQKVGGGNSGGRNGSSGVWKWEDENWYDQDHYKRLTKYNEKSEHGDKTLWWYDEAQKGNGDDDDDSSGGRWGDSFDALSSVDGSQQHLLPLTMSS